MTADEARRAYVRGAWDALVSRGYGDAETLATVFRDIGVTPAEAEALAAELREGAKDEESVAVVRGS